MGDVQRRGRWFAAVAGVAVATALVGAATAPRAKPLPVAAAVRQQPRSYASFPRDYAIPVQPVHILWLNIRGRWRAVPK